MNITLSVDEQLVTRARKLQTIADDDPERSIEEFKGLSGGGNSRGWRFNRDEIHERS
jgi:hypothetical protein